MEQKKLSTIFKLLRELGFNYSEEKYVDVSIFRVIWHFFHNIRMMRLQNMMDWAILEPFNPRKIRPHILKKMGCHMGKDVFIGDHVILDLTHGNLITPEYHVHIASGFRRLCHQRDLSNYCVGDDYAKLGYTLKPIMLKKCCLIGMESFVLPGMTVGEGTIMGAGSLVTKGIPDRTIASGRPARVVKVMLRHANNQDVVLVGEDKQLTVDNERVRVSFVHVVCNLTSHVEERRAA